MNHNNLTGNGIKNLYISPLAEEIVISFEEAFLIGTNPTSSSLNGRITGSPGSAGNPDDPNDFDGGSIDL